MPQDPNLPNRPLQWRDLSSPQRRIVSDNLREAGENLPKTATESAARFEATHERTGNPKARVQAASARAVAPHLVSQPATLQRAANTRQRLYNRGIENRAAENPDDPHQVIPTGAGWYFNHHQAIADSAEKHGFPKDWAIAASGVMSPQNSPENERASVHAIMDALSNHSVRVTPAVQTHLARSGLDVSEHAGKTVHYDQLPPGSIAHLSSGNFRDQVDTGANLREVARGGTKQNIMKAEKILAGDIHPNDAMSPHSAPKVWSYIHNTRQAEPGSPTHVEYMGRVHQDALVRRGQISADQQSLDLYGHKEKNLPDEHLLSEHSHTVEDTWQNSATFDQPMTMAGGKTSVYKAAGSLPETYPIRGIKTRTNEETGKRESAHTDPRITNVSITHAVNNRATQKAAEQQGVPPQAVQEVGWVQMRKEAGKDAAFNHRPQEKADPLGGHVHGQLALFGAHIPAKAPRSSAITEEDIPSNPESDMRKWAAISKNSRRARFNRQAGEVRDMTQ